MRIATWNINSVRLRIDMVIDFLKNHDIDILCLQETKCPDEHFPHADFIAAGYDYRHIKGMKSYNGVAIISRLPFKETGTRNWCEKEDCRHISVRLENDIELHNFYVPAGGNIPDIETNPKFVHKLQFVDEMADFWENERSQNDKMIMVGDLNIAPLENDVWSHKQMRRIISHTPIEVEKLTIMQKSIGWHDAARHFIPEEEKLYSWWSYRAKDWKKSNRGRRLDHFWVTQPLKDSLKAHETIYEARSWQPKPSDHVPVVIDIEH